MFRKILFWMHLTAGAVAGLVILIMSVTGALLTYEKQMLQWADRGANTAPPYAGAPRLPLEALLGKVREKTGAVPSSVLLRSGASEPVALTMPEGTLLANAYTGELLGPQSARLRAFFRSVTDWHRWLGAAPEGRANARRITGASNLLFLFLVISGLYLWFPRKWQWPNFRAVLWFRGGLRSKARDFNWHNVAGFWCCVPLFFVVLSAVVISYPWASNLVYRAAGTEPPAQGKGKAGPKGKGGLKGGPRAQPREVNFAGLDALLARAQSEMPDWQSITVRIPESGREPVTFNLDASFGGQPQKRATLALDRTTGEVRMREDWSTLEAGRRARSWMRFVHTGEYYGVAGQTVAGIASAGGALLVWTGLSLGIRRFRNWLGRARTRAEVEYPDKEKPCSVSTSSSR